MSLSLRPPAERVRERLAAIAGPSVASALPRGYQRLGRVLVLRLPERLRPQFREIGRAYLEELGVTTVLRHGGRTEGEHRRPLLEVIAGGPTETEVVEHGVRYRLDAAEIMFAQGNRTERRRAGELVRPGETVVDLFAGIGYFSLPAAVHGRAARVHAVEVNPTAFRYLVENAALNHVADRIVPLLGDNRSVDLPPRAADRVFLGYLPSAVPWVDRALELVRPGGSLHVHTVGETRGGSDAALERVRAAVDRTGTGIAEVAAREVKPYGPGRAHYVVDVTLGRRA